MTQKVDERARKKKYLWDVEEKAELVLSFLAEITENPYEGYEVLSVALEMLEAFFFEANGLEAERKRARRGA